VRPSQRDMVLSDEAVKTVFEKFKNSTELTESACPLKVYRQRKLKNNFREKLIKN
jgi:hypothetical protein